MALLLFSFAIAFGEASGNAYETYLRYMELYQAKKPAEAIPYAQRYLEIIEKNPGKQDQSAISALNDLATLYRLIGEYAKAEPLLKRSLAIREKALGPEHPDVAQSLNNLGLLYQDMGDYAKAEPLFQRIVAIMEKALGPEHPNVAFALGNLALLYQVTGDYAKAEPLCLRALAIEEKVLGPDDPDIATSLNNLAQLYTDMGNYARAEPLFERSLAIREKALGPKHPDLAPALNNLAYLYQTLGDYAKAEAFYRRSLDIREQALGPEHRDVASSRNNLGLLYRAMGDYAKSESLLKRSLAIWEKTLGPEHPDVARSLNNLAELYQAMGDYAKAEPLYQRAIAIGEKPLGLGHPVVATFLNNLGELYQALGDYAKAEPLLKRALVIWEIALGPVHPEVATALNNLASLSQSIGDYARAEAFYQRSLAIWEKALGPEHPDVARSLNNLAELYQAMGDYAKAEPLSKRSLAIREKALGSEHPDVAQSLNNLAVLYQSIGDYGKAEPLLKRSLAIREKALGPEHPDVAQSLNNLAILSQSIGDYAQSEAFYLRSLAVWEKALGPEHPTVAVLYSNLASFDARRKRYSSTFRSLKKGLAIEDRQIQNIFTITTEQQKLQFMQSITGSYWCCLSLIHQHLKSDRDAVRFGLELVIRRKGIVLEAQSRANEALRGHLSEAARADWELLSSLRSALSRLLLYRPEKLSGEEYRARLAALQGQIEEVEKRLSEESALVAEQLKQREATVEAVAKALPPGSALIEFVKIEDFDFATSRWVQNWRYLAFVLNPSGNVQLIDLGNANALEQGVRRALNDIRALTTSSTRQKVLQSLKSLGMLYQQVWAPLEGRLRGVEKVLVSADGMLNLVPFAALEDGKGKVVLERFVLGYISSGRELVGAGAGRMKAQGELLLVANPAYEGGAGGQGGGGSKMTREFQGKFSALPGTEQEAREIAALVSGAKVVLEGVEATEAAVKEARAPRILHLATHGFFLKDENVNPASPQSTERGLSIVTQSSPARTERTSFENPLVRSGLAFAGANHASETEEGDDGILTALEISGMDLWGTELVVLSACETAVGEVFAGEGVFGLRRSFGLAGAKSLLMSLWPVGDWVTVEQMKEFYRRMGSEPLAAALRGAQLATLLKLREEHGVANPVVWAPFIIQGAEVLGESQAF
ncbi:MAG: CHAT domain-containing protein [Spirochaetes bacterium]|nr:CHAT domain-containing protein [Spirochaetota bacterium]